MSFESFMLCRRSAKSDAIRDAAIPFPEGVTECRNISYGPHSDSSLLDVYYPQNAASSLPTIVSIHGGGYVYGSKEIYHRYCMDLARRGFAVVNFNYRLAPKWKFPTPLADTNSVLQWVKKNAAQYHMDADRIFLVGDSAGAQLASQYAAMYANPEYAALFRLDMAKVKIRAVGLNCGMYDMAASAAGKRKGIFLDYLGKSLSADDPRFRVLENIDGRFPPAFITTSCHDFLRPCAEPMWRFLTDKGVEAQWKCYGTEAAEHVAHVFHVNIILPEAVQCNDDTVSFFRKYL